MQLLGYNGIRPRNVREFLRLPFGLTKGVRSPRLPFDDHFPHPINLHDVYL
jgi:hypothetical protein